VSYLLRFNGDEREVEIDPKDVKILLASPLVTREGSSMIPPSGDRDDEEDGDPAHSAFTGDGDKQK
jgi:hypothetical protein